jgi:CRISPR-associated endonuclease Csy4
MTRYQDLELLPDVELPIFFIRNKVYTKLHKAIFDLNASDIGVSFPQAKERLGCVIRIHSTKDRLNELQKLNWHLFCLDKNLKLLHHKSLCAFL